MRSSTIATISFISIFVFSVTLLSLLIIFIKPKSESPPSPPSPPVENEFIPLSQFLTNMMEDTPLTGAQSNFVVLRVGEKDFLSPDQDFNTLTTFQTSPPFPSTMYFALMVEKPEGNYQAFKSFVWTGGDIHFIPISSSNTSYTTSLTPQANFFPNWIPISTSECNSNGMWVYNINGKNDDVFNLVNKNSQITFEQFQPTNNCQTVQQVYVYDTQIPLPQPS